MRRLSIVLGVCFAVALLMGPGPGLLLANTARPWWGLPPLYWWACLWYAVLVGVVLLAYLFVWDRS